MYVLQCMHEYTVNIDDTLISNLMYLQLVLLKLNISTCYWCSFLRINTLGQSMPNAQVTHSRISSPVLLRIKSHGWPRKCQYP